MIRLSRTLMLVGAQLLVNVFLALWLFNEYLHNQYMQEYLAKFWLTSTPAFSIALAAAGLIAGGSYLAFSRRRSFVEPAEPRGSPVGESVSSSGLVTLDVCPYCNVALKTLSENRFQCRKCRRYFRK